MAQSRLKRSLRWVPAIIWMGVIFYLSHQTGDELGGMLPLFQKFIPGMESFNWGHLAAYFILALTYYWALLPSLFGLRGKLASVVLCVLYGITDEFHQRFVEGRYPDMQDLLNDTIGAAIAMLLISIPALERFLHKHTSSNNKY